MASLPSELRAAYDRRAVPAIRVAHEGGVPIWVFGRSGTTVLGYDEVEQSYGTGTVESSDLMKGTVVADWRMYDELRWALRPFAGLTLESDETHGQTK